MGQIDLGIPDNSPVMLNLKDIRGLKFPDIYVVRYFFKELVNKTPGRVLELGCGSGNNLILFQQYGWNITGVDYSACALEDARHNLSLYEIGEPCVLVKHDLAHGLPPTDANYDVILMPGILSYLRKDAMIKCFKQTRHLLTEEASFFMRLRTLGDHRYCRGERIERNTYILDTSETGEANLLNTFYQEHEIVDMIRAHLLPADKRHIPLTILQVQFDDIQDGVITTNKDIVIWGSVV